MSKKKMLPLPESFGHLPCVGMLIMKKNLLVQEVLLCVWCNLLLRFLPFVLPDRPGRSGYGLRKLLVPSITAIEPARRICAGLTVLRCITRGVRRLR